MSSSPGEEGSAIGRFAVRHALAIVFITAALCLAGLYSARNMPSSVFPKTDFPRCVILVDNGVMPADEMMSTITRPIEETMKDIPGAVSVRSSTGRGSAEINVFFDWKTPMEQAELYVNSRLSQIRATLPTSATTTVWRLTFTAFPITGISLTSPTRDTSALWEIARYDIKPRFLRIPGVARVDIVGGRAPEYQVVVDPIRLTAAGLTFADVANALNASNTVSPAGLHEEDHLLYLTVVDGRLKDADQIAALTVAAPGGHPIRIGDFAKVQRGPEPIYNVVTAQGVNAVLLNVRSQPDGSTLDIADALREEIAHLRSVLPADTRLDFYYDQSVLVRSSVGGVWESIFFGLILSVVIIYLFLRDWGTTLTAVTVIPVAVLMTLVVMHLLGMSFNLMTLGGIAAAIGLVIDDAIVVVESIHARIIKGGERLAAIRDGIGDIIAPLVGSTLTPVVVFIPLAFLDGLTGVFFRALALTMVSALLTSLLLALTLTPALAGWFVRQPKVTTTTEENGLLGRCIRIYENTVRLALRRMGWTLGLCGLVLLATAFLYQRLQTDFLPEMDEGGFVIDYFTPPGTSLTETDRQLREVEKVLRATPEVEGYSRRTGARLALAIAEPNTGDFLVKLRDDRTRTTEEVLDAVRAKAHEVAPGVDWDLHGILGDLIGDLTWSPKPIEVKIFSPDVAFLEQKAPVVEKLLASVPGVVDTNDGLTYTGPSLRLNVRSAEARRAGLTTTDIATAVRSAMIGETATSVQEGDRTIAIRIKADAAATNLKATLLELPLRTAAGQVIKLSQVADLDTLPGQLELRREDLRQAVAVTARLEGRDLGSAMAMIKEKVAKESGLPANQIEYGGLYQQQQESFARLMVVLSLAIVLVFTVLLIEFRTFQGPVAIVSGAILALFGTVTALWITGVTLNVVSFLGAIIGIGIVAKNGILMLDCVSALRAEGLTLTEALVASGRRRLRPVLMTSLAAAFGLLPLAYGIGTGSDMLKPLAIAVIGALGMSVLFSLIATPVVYALLDCEQAA